MATVDFLQIDGVTGESTDPAHKDWIEVLSFSNGVTQTPVTGGPTKVPVTAQHDLTVTKKIDKSSPKLFQFCSSGKHISKVTLELMQDKGGVLVTSLTIAMSQVVISRVTAAKSLGEGPLETVTFHYGSVLWTYAPLPIEGKDQALVQTGWDVAGNRELA